MYTPNAIKIIDFLYVVKYNLRIRTYTHLHARTQHHAQYNV